ncbi:hypothetical protein BLNAU_6997 [Blattamonas nauphoetae]|uniref:Tc1-like transposase DDE domain-containing protein n=1 Tax=Blattamonas nauphoetae TaxID=2049346 RepID=A0ABQ9Y2X7_9EUKA|nr:hypothetical protein BLNAU_6997 [Blattamonas nauphoetae]
MDPDLERPVRERPAINTEKTMLVLFFTPRLTYIHLVPRGQKINAVYFRTQSIQPLRTKFNAFQGGIFENFPLSIHMDNVPAHNANQTRNALAELYFPQDQPSPIFP